ncbi:MAG: hypothetical protein PVJ55_11060, partial [Anaerolineae bacterium]
TLVVVTAIVTDRLADVMADLRDAGRRLALVSLESEPPPFLSDIVTYHLNPSVQEIQHLSDTAYSATEALQAADLLRLDAYRQPARKSVARGSRPRR